METTESRGSAMDRYRGRFVRWATAIGFVLCLLLIPLDWFVRESVEATLWTCFFAGMIGLAGITFRIWRSCTLWAALVGFSLLIHLALVDPEFLALGYIWGYVFPLGVLFVAGFRAGLAINVIAFFGFVAIIFIRDIPGLTHLRGDIVLSLAGVNAFALLYEYVRGEHAQRLEAAMATDWLTNLWNRRTFETAIEGEVKRAERSGSPFSLLLFDVDNFKPINDANGHPVGDEVLKRIAEAIRQTIRQSDLAARVGGDEFAVIAPETPARVGESEETIAGGKVLAERLRTAITEFEYPCDEPVEISIGVATFREGDTSTTLYKRADDALYEAKADGRNVVRIAS